MLFFLFGVSRDSLIAGASFKWTFEQLSFWHFSVDFIFQQQVDGSY